jgi:uncharacterized membrane protein
VRDINRAYRDAMAQEYAALVSAGRDDEAEHVAEELKSQYDVEVRPAREKKAAAPEEPKAPAVPERADVPHPPENTAEPRPAPRRPGRPRKTADSKPEPGEK